VLNSSTRTAADRASGSVNLSGQNDPNKTARKLPSKGKGIAFLAEPERGFGVRLKAPKA
jgi:hypothetical protein